MLLGVNLVEMKYECALEVTIDLPNKKKDEEVWSHHKEVLKLDLAPLQKGNSLLHDAK